RSSELFALLELGARPDRDERRESRHIARGLRLDDQRRAAFRPAEVIHHLEMVAFAEVVDGGGAGQIVVAQVVAQGGRNRDQLVRLDDQPAEAFACVRLDRIAEARGKLVERFVRRGHGLGGGSVFCHNVSLMLACAAGAAGHASASAARVSSAGTEACRFRIWSWRGSIRSGPRIGTGTASLGPLLYQGILFGFATDWLSIFLISVMKPYSSACGVGGQPGT